MSQLVQKGDLRSSIAGFASVMVLAAILVLFLRLTPKEKPSPDQRGAKVSSDAPSRSRGEFEWQSGVNSYSLARSIEISSSTGHDLSKMDDDSLVRFLGNLRTEEEEDAWWKSALTEIALIDIRRALNLASLAPSHVQGETLIAQTIASERGGDGLVELARLPIGGLALAAGLGNLDSGEVALVIKDLVDIRGKFGAEEMSGLLGSRDGWGKDDADLLLAALDPAHWSLSSSSKFSSFAGCLMNCDVGEDVIKEKLLEFGQGNPLLVATALADLQLSRVQLTGEGNTDQKTFEKLRESAVSKDQADKLLARYAFGRALSNGGVESLDWALSQTSSDDRRISTHAILNGLLGNGGIGNETLYSDLEKKIASDPGSKIWPAMNEWLGKLAARKPEWHANFVGGLPREVKSRLEVFQSARDSEGDR